MNAVVQAQPQHRSLLTKIAERFSVEPNKMLATLKATAFKGDVSNEQMVALLVVADQYKLNPFTRELYGFPDRQNGIVPVVGVDGWSRIINEHPQFDGMEFVDGPANANGVPEWIECVMYRKDRSHAIRAREYFAECRRDVAPWKSHPRRMLRHKSLIQCARLAFGFTGIYDQDEAERIVDVTPQRAESAPAIASLNERIAGRRPAAAEAVVEDVEDVSGDAPALTFAQVADQLQRATSSDTLAVAADLIGQVADEGQRAELAGIYQQLSEKFAG